MVTTYLKFLVCCFLFIIFACSCRDSDQQNNSADIDLLQIKEKRKLVAITGYNAYSYFVYKGQPMGFEYDLVKDLTDHLGLDLEIVIEKDINKMFEKLNSGEGDLIAFNLTMTKDRADKVNFTKHHNTTVQVLVQRRPENWRQLRVHEIENSLIRSPIDLEGKTVHVRANSAFLTRLANLSNEIGGDINITEADPELSTEELIEMVASGEIDYTIADQNVARLYQSYFNILDIATKISLPQRIAWAVRKTSPQLLSVINDWIVDIQKRPEYYATYKKYYMASNQFKSMVKSDFLLNRGGKISEYDDIVKNYSKKLKWDWRLIASQIYQESQFDPEARSWAGAVGLMQMLPTTARSYGAVDPFDPEQSLKAGVDYMLWLDNYFIQYVEDTEERKKFVLAAYNVGFGHVEDAIRLAEKYGSDPAIWEGSVAEFLLKKSKKKYYSDEVVKNGYCRGIETIKYVTEIFERYEQYKQFIG